MSRASATQLERRLELLVLEAEVQRATLAASIGQLEQKRVLAWATGAGRLLFQAFASPRVRWLLMAAIWRRFVRRRRA